MNKAGRNGLYMTFAVRTAPAADRRSFPKFDCARNENRLQDAGGPPGRVCEQQRRENLTGILRLSVVVAVLVPATGWPVLFLERLEPSAEPSAGLLQRCRHGKPPKSQCHRPVFKLL